MNLTNLLSSVKTSQSLFLGLIFTAILGVLSIVALNILSSKALALDSSSLENDPRIACVQTALGLSSPNFGPNINNTTIIYWDQRVDKNTLFSTGTSCGLDFPKPGNFSSQAMEGVVKGKVGQPAENQSTYRHVNVEGSCANNNIPQYKAFDVKISEDTDCNQPEFGYKVNYWWNVRVGDTDQYTNHITEGIGDGDLNGFSALICNPSCKPAVTPPPTPPVTPPPATPPVTTGPTVIQNQKQENTQKQDVTVNVSPAVLGAQTKVEIPVVVSQSKGGAKELPKTGLPLAGVALASLLPIGKKLKGFGNSNKEEESANSIWMDRQFKD